MPPSSASPSRARGLGAITGSTQQRLNRVLAAWYKDLLAIQSDPRSPERGQYVFVQDLVRSVAYGTLARRDRKLRHVAAATYLESDGRRRRRSRRLLPRTWSRRMLRIRTLRTPPRSEIGPV